MGLERAARHRQIVAIATASRQQGGIFLANQRYTEPRHQSTVEDIFRVITPCGSAKARA
jgi:hypothetical protein